MFLNMLDDAVQQAGVGQGLVIMLAAGFCNPDSNCAHLGHEMDIDTQNLKPGSKTG